jgi:hypothetical protein
VTVQTMSSVSLFKCTEIEVPVLGPATTVVPFRQTMLVA